MHIPGRTEEYERTCDDCGQTWRVPREFAKHVKPLPLRGIRGQYVDPADVQAHEEWTEAFEAYRMCPKCSSQHYSQRPIRS